MPRSTGVRLQDRLKSRAAALKRETHALAIAFADPRTPWLARIVVALTVAYALSPIDLIPDPIPVLGYLDDLVIVPAGIALALKLIPSGVMVDARASAADPVTEARMGRWGVAIVAMVWALGAAFVLALWWRLSRR